MYVHDFSSGGTASKDLLGGKGAGLAEMTSLGLPVPPGFTISTDACRAYLAGGDLPDGLWEEVEAAVGRLETRTGRHFGEGAGPPLLLSVRSGAKFSMPGMMDTVLNLGITDPVTARLAAWSGDEHFAWDAHRRFFQTYGKVVLGVPGDSFEEVLTELRDARGVADDSKLTTGDLEAAARRFAAITAEAAEPVPADPWEQLYAAVVAVFRSWNGRRARSYRRIHRISDSLGTAVNVQMMVFGDLDDSSGTGVCFTRDPATGEAVPYGDYLPNAQGEDVVAGIRNTLTLDELASRHPGHHAHLLKVMGRLERHYRDMCDIEFTVERDKLWILQTRVGKRTARAAVRIATNMVAEGLIDQREAVLRVDADSLVQLLHPSLPKDVAEPPLARGVPASPGAAAGAAVFDADLAETWAAAGRRVILVRAETTPDDIHGMAAAVGILTSHGGKTSHAAVVARGMGTPAVTGTAALAVDAEARVAVVDGHTIAEGDIVTIDGTSGTVYGRAIELVEPEATVELDELLAWADAYRRLGVRANADTPRDAAAAVRWGADGIGLARTEHMFLGDRLPVVQQLIMDADGPGGRAALEELRKLQAADFAALLEAMDGRSVIVRLLDPPLHEFLPDPHDLEREGAAPDYVAKVEAWQETNPMLGLRGVRLGLVFPDIYRTQVRAALDAVQARLDAGGDPRLEIMVPLVADAEELHRVRLMIDDEIAAASAAAGRDLDVPVGAMIETPRAALTAREIARDATFFSFGSNDLTQMTYGFSRDDAEERFIRRYLDDGVLARNPFETLDRNGVGRLVRIATVEGKTARPRLVAGICGEHGGDPESIRFCHEAGLDYVSCSPPRVPVARLAAAQAAIGEAASTSSV